MLMYFPLYLLAISPYVGAQSLKVFPIRSRLEARH